MARARAQRTAVAGALAGTAAATGPLWVARRCNGERNRQHGRMPFRNKGREACAAHRMPSYRSAAIMQTPGVPSRVYISSSRALQRGAAQEEARLRLG